MRQSQPPSPGPAVTTQAIQRSETKKDQETKGDQGAPQAPSLTNRALVPADNPQKQAQALTPEIQQPATVNQPAIWPPTRWDANWAMFIVSVALLAVAVAEWVNNFLSIGHNRAVERAYVKMSHEPPGLFATDLQKNLSPQIQPDMPLWVSVQVKNQGHTPAKILAVVVTCHVAAELPEAPPYTEHETWGEFFLMADGAFNAGNMVHGGLTAEQLQAIRNDTLRLWVVGYVDYEDAFGVISRNGYARRLNMQMPNNLVFETKKGYNYDQELHRQPWYKRWF